MTKVIIMEIDNCFKCPNFRDYLDSGAERGKCHLVTVGRNFRNITIYDIPDWCPLPDKEHDEPSR